MTTDVVHRDIMKAAALGDSETANQLYGQLTVEGRESYNIFVIAMFAGAMGVRFKDDQSLEAIRRFAAEMQYDYRDAEPPVKQLTVELVIRAMMGEEHLFEEISGEEQLRIQLLSIRKVVDQSEQMKARLDDHLTDAEALAAQWVGGE
ncbi:MAG: hypothetical protein ACRDXX_01880 [Stackebrandtia sp.]